MWLTCCAFHNILLDIDGLDLHWLNFVLSDWEGSLGQLNGDEATFAFQRLNAVARPVLLGLSSLQAIDTSGMGPCNDGDGKISNAIRNLVPDPNDNFNIEVLTKNVNTVRVLWHLSLQFFKSNLIEHIDILWKQNNFVITSKCN